MLSVKNLCRPGLKPASLQIEAGECVTLSGPSGSGKSLLLRAIADLDPNEGRVHLDGVDRAAMSAPAWRRKVGYLPAETGWWAPDVQSHFLDPQQAIRITTSLHLAPDCMSWPVERLSTGEKQRLGLARLLERQPIAYLLDEPTSALDPASVEAVERIIMDMLDQGAAILMTTHDAAQSERLGARQLRIADGLLDRNNP